MQKAPNVLVLLESSRRFGRALMRGMAGYSRLNGPWTFHKTPAFYLSSGNKERKLLNHIKNLDINAICTRETPNIEEILSLGLPTVVAPVSRRYFPRTISIVGDNFAVGRMAAEHFLEKGFKNFAYCGFDEFFWSHERGKGFAERLAKEGLKVDFFRQSRSAAARVWAKERFTVAKWLQSLNKPVGLMTVIDERSENIVDACKLAGLYVPEEVAIMGVDNDDLVCEMSNPPLSSIALNDEMVGYIAAETLDKQLKGSKIKDPFIKLLPTHIITRQSTETYAIEDRDIMEALRFIRNHAKDNIGVDAVTDHVACSRRTLQKKFKGILGRTIFDEIIYVRIEIACKMLLETRLSISEIALSLRFTNINHISRWFKQIKGMTPLAYRKTYGHR